MKSNWKAVVFLHLFLFTVYIYLHEYTSAETFTTGANVPGKQQLIILKDTLISYLISR